MPGRSCRSRGRTSLQILLPAQRRDVVLQPGPHPPRLWPEDLALLHRLWLELSERGCGPKLHHRDVIRVALRRLDSEMHSKDAGEILDSLREEVAHEAGEPAAEKDQ